MDKQLLEKMIIKACSLDTAFTAVISSVFQKEYFDNQTAANIYDFIIKHFREYGNIAPRIAIISDLDKEGTDDAKRLFDEIDAIDFDYIRNYQYLFDRTNEYLKEKAIKKAILSSVDIINTKPEEIINIRRLVEEALCKDLKIDLGLNYFNTLSERLTRIFSTSLTRIPTYFPQFDEYISGGFPPFTLSVIVARIHGFKSATLSNFAANQILHGHDVVLASMEMSEDAFAQRFDSLFSLLDINKMYRELTHKSKLIKNLKEVQQKEGRGNLFIKQYPTGQATTNDFRAYLRELKIRGSKPSVFYCDYLNIMKPSYKSRGDMYNDVKGIAEELRALSFEFEIPVISVSQLNREGSNVPFEQIDFTYISECLSLNSKVDKKNNNGYDTVKIMDLKAGDKIRGYEKDVVVKRIFDIKKKKCLKIKTKGGKEIICSVDHKIPTHRGMLAANNLRVNDKININNIRG